MLLDTSGLLWFHHAAEPQHEEAVTFFHAAPARITHMSPSSVPRYLFLVASLLG